MSATISRRESIGKPSSSTNAADRASGRAPIMARSLTVPCTARWPADPPGKRSGLTTNESVLKASRSPDGSVKHGGVRLGGQCVVGEGGQENGVEQRRRRLAAGTVGQGHHLVEQAGAGGGGRPRCARTPPLPGHALAVSCRATSVMGTPSSPSGCCTVDHSCQGERVLGLLDAVDAVGAHHQAERPRRRCRPWRRPRNRTSPMVSRPRRDASSNARNTFREPPLVENPIAMSPARAWAMIWREKTSSKPTSLARAVSTARSSTRDIAGQGLPARRVAEQRHRPFGVGGAATVAECEQAGRRRGSGLPCPACAAATASAHCSMRRCS